MYLCAFGSSLSQPLSKRKSKAKCCQHGDTKNTLSFSAETPAQARYAHLRLLSAPNVPPGCLAILTIFYEALFQRHILLMLNFRYKLQEKHGGSLRQYHSNLLQPGCKVGGNKIPNYHAGHLAIRSGIRAWEPMLPRVVPVPWAPQMWVSVAVPRLQPSTSPREWRLPASVPAAGF